MADAIDTAAARAAEPAADARAGGQLALSTGRVVRIDIPVPLTVDEMVELLVALPGGVVQLHALASQPAAGRIALPDGSLRPVAKSA